VGVVGPKRDSPPSEVGLEVHFLNGCLEVHSQRSICVHPLLSNHILSDRPAKPSLLRGLSAIHFFLPCSLYFLLILLHSSRILPSFNFSACFFFSFLASVFLSAKLFGY